MAEKKMVVLLQGEDNLTPVVEKAGKSIQGFGSKVDDTKDSLTRFYEENRKGDRTLNYAISQGREMFNGLALSVTMLGLAGKDSSKEMKNLTDAVGKGLVALQGFEGLAGLFGIGGPWALAIGAIAGVTTALIDLNDTSEETEARLEEQKKRIEEITKAYEAWLGKLQGTDSANREATRAERDAIASRMRIIQSLIDAHENGTGQMIVRDEEVALAQRVQAELAGKNVNELRQYYAGLEKQVEALGRALLTVNEIEVSVQAGRTKLPYGKEDPRSATNSLRIQERIARSLGDIMKKDIEEVSQKYLAIGVTSENIKITWEELSTVEQAWVAGLQSGVYSVANSIRTNVSKAWEDAFGEANSLLEIFIQNMLSQIAGNLATDLGGSLISGLFSIIPGGGIISDFLGGIFHSGGTVPKAHSGAYVNAPSNREFPVMVRGGETIRTEEQEKELRSSMRGGGTSITLNVGTAIGGRQFVRDALAELRRQTGLSIDALTRDRSATVQIGA